MNQITKLSDDVTVISAEINSYKQIAGQAVFEIGARLKHVRDNNLAHGEWETWCESSLNISARQARKYIRVFEKFANRNLGSEMGLKKMDLLTAFDDEELEEVKELPSGEQKRLLDMSQKEIEQYRQAKQEAERRAEELEAEKERLEKQLKDVVPIDQLDDVVSFRLEQHYEQTEIEKQQIIAEKDRKIRELESRKPEVVTKEVVPQKFKDELEEAKHFVRKLTAERKELEAKHKELNDLEYREKKLQIEGRISIYEMQIKIKNFITDAAPTIFQQGAIAANPIMKKEIEESIISLEEFCLTLRDVLNSKIQIVEVQP